MTRIASRLALLSTLAGCAGEPRHDGPAFTIDTDSAGVRTVVNFRPAWAAGEEWRLSPEPMFRIGGPADHLAALHSMTGIAAIDRTDGDSGTPVLAIAMGDELLFCDVATGEVHRIDRTGEGPGEFRGLDGVVAYGDTAFAAYDSSLRRILLYDVGGSHLRDIRLDDGIGDDVMLGTLPGGAFVFAHHAMPVGSGRASVTYTIHEPDAARSQQVETGPGFEWFTPDVDGVPGLPLRPPLGARPVASAARGHVYIAHGDVYEVRVYDAAGSLRRRIRRAIQRTPYSEDVLEARRNDMLRLARDEAASRRGAALWDQAPVPDMAPALNEIVADAAGNLWVRETRMSGQASAWVVYDDTGRLLGSVEVPQDLGIYEIGTDYLVGLRLDDFGVPEILIYRLAK